MSDRSPVMTSECVGTGLWDSVEKNPESHTNIGILFIIKDKDQKKSDLLK